MSTKHFIFSVLLLVACLTLAISSSAQSNEADCFEIKHLDFFGIKPDSKINWSDEELDKLIEMGESKKSAKTSIHIAPIVFQLRAFHPDCSKSADKVRYDKLITVYFNIRRQDPSKLLEKTIADQLLFIREDFYAQLQDDKLLPDMFLSFDDGPLYGIETDTNLKPVTGKSAKTSFGRIVIVNSQAGAGLVALDTENKVIWSKIITSVRDENLKSLDFAKEAVEETSLVTFIHLTSGEKLTLYLRPNGTFLFYYLSW